MLRDGKGTLGLVLLRRGLRQLDVLLSGLGNSGFQLLVQSLDLSLGLLELGLQSAAVVGKKGNLVELLGVLSGETRHEVVLL